MATELKLFGPYEAKCPSGGRVKFIDKNEKKAFLEVLDDESVSSKQGCYIFALRAAQSKQSKGSFFQTAAKQLTLNIPPEISSFF